MNTKNTSPIHSSDRPGTLSIARTNIPINILLQPSSVSGNVSQIRSIRIGPSGIIRLRLPRPVHPPSHARLLVQLLLSREELVKELLVLPVIVGRHAPLASKGEVLAADGAVVRTRAVHERVCVASLVALQGETNVVVVVEGGEAVVGYGGDGARVA